MSTLRLPIVAFALALAAACAGSPSSRTAASADPQQGPARGSRDVIIEEELSAPGIGNLDALSAVRQLRPHFLVTRGSGNTRSMAGQVRVSVDNGAPVAMDALSGLRASEIREMRYLSPTDASQQFGTAAGAGAMIVVRRK